MGRIAMIAPVPSSAAAATFNEPMGFVISDWEN
jgi:hypothetical protein